MRALRSVSLWTDFDILVRVSWQWEPRSQPGNDAAAVCATCYCTTVQPLIWAVREKTVFAGKYNRCVLGCNFKVCHPRCVCNSLGGRRILFSQLTLSSTTCRISDSISILATCTTDLHFHLFCWLPLFTAAHRVDWIWLQMQCQMWDLRYIFSMLKPWNEFSWNRSLN